MIVKNGVGGWEILLQAQVEGVGIHQGQEADQETEQVNLQ